MPWKSDRQRRWGHWAAKHGEFPASKVAEFDAASKGKRLPEHKAKGGVAEYPDVVPTERAQENADRKYRRKARRAAPGRAQLVSDFAEAIRRASPRGV